ncbi:MAG: large subunit ribosomal protein L19 [Parcubacteria group bacterium Athens1014_10]|nr:MAG: large subunit ribosomal protein L19 [Parcubacteria group bacterium Athens1014_10]TSD05900.1 MAG: large subunit ribosomal protein L19 [Parcubacteria group bacterium Athens0714_12]
MSEKQIDSEQKEDKKENSKKTEEKTLPEIKPGMTIKVHQKIIETNSKGEKKERIQIFEGMVLGIKGVGKSKTFTVRKNSFGIGVEKIFPLYSPVIAKIEIVKKAKVKKAKLFYLRNYNKKLKEEKV